MAVNKPIQIRVQQEFLRKIDDYRRDSPDLPSRAEALRRLASDGLRVHADPRLLKNAILK